LCGLREIFFRRGKVIDLYLKACIVEQKCKNKISARKSGERRV
jgi:hypothetical protein